MENIPLKRYEGHFWFISGLRIPVLGEDHD
jgi:hypothetical protein